MKSRFMSFNNLAVRALLSVKPLALRARVFKPNKTLLLVNSRLLKQNDPTMDMFKLRTVQIEVK